MRAQIVNTEGLCQGCCTRSILRSLENFKTDPTVQAGRNTGGNEFRRGYNVQIL